MSYVIFPTFSHILCTKRPKAYKYFTCSCDCFGHSKKQRSTDRYLESKSICNRNNLLVLTLPGLIGLNVSSP